MALDKSEHKLHYIQCFENEQDKSVFVLSESFMEQCPLLKAAACNNVSAKDPFILPSFASSWAVKKILDYFNHHYPSSPSPLSLSSTSLVTSVSSSSSWLLKKIFNPFGQSSSTTSSSSSPSSSSPPSPDVSDNENNDDDLESISEYSLNDDIVVVNPVINDNDNDDDDDDYSNLAVMPGFRNCPEQCDRYSYSAGKYGKYFREFQEPKKPIIVDPWDAKFITLSDAKLADLLNTAAFFGFDDLIHLICQKIIQIIWSLTPIEMIERCPAFKNLQNNVDQCREDMKYIL